MTESDVYQLIGKAYCAGVDAGISKQASLEKQALSPALLGRAFKKIRESGDVGRTANMIGRIISRVDGVDDARDTGSIGHMNYFKRNTYDGLLKKWYKLNNRAINFTEQVKHNNPSENGKLWDTINNSIRASAGASPAYAKSIANQVNNAYNKAGIGAKIGVGLENLGLMIADKLGMDGI